MESSDNKTPRAVSGRPSLLSPPAGAAPDNHSHTRMLASLERDGKIPASVSAGRRPSRSKYGFAALAMVLVGGVGAFVAFASFDDASASVAATPPSGVVAVPEAARPASVALAAATSAPLAASAPAVAVARIEPATVSVPEAVSGATVAQVLPPVASQPQANPLDKLALRDPESSTPPVHAGTGAATVRKDKPRAKPAAGAKAQAVASAKPAPPRADAKAPAAARRSRKAEDDADTELVAAIIARLDKRGSKPAVAAPVVVAEATPANVTSQVHQCSANSDLVEARQCRNKACDGHWGKVDACPASRAPKTSRSDGVGSDERG